MLNGTTNIEINKTKYKSRNATVSSGAYGLGFIGALIYFLQHAVSFWGGVLGVLKALVWPAIIVYHLLEHLGL